MKLLLVILVPSVLSTCNPTATFGVGTLSSWEDSDTGTFGKFYKWLVVWMKNVLHRFRSLNLWSPAGRSVVLSSGQLTEPFGDGELPEDVHHWGAGLRVHSLTPLPVRSPFFSLCFQCAGEMWSLHFQTAFGFMLLLPHVPSHAEPSSSGTVSQNKSFLHKVFFGHGVPLQHRKAMNSQNRDVNLGSLNLKAILWTTSYTILN